MKKIILGAFLTLLIIFSLTIIKPNKAKAETPDLFLMNEIFLYDYDSFNFEPNFTNDYLLMTTILPSDVESNISAFLGWYKNLGYNNLLIPYYGDDVDNDKRGYFAIPLNGVLGANFQLGYNAQSPFAISFGVAFTDGTMQTWDTETNGYGSQILTLNQNNLIKNIYCFWWEYKTADYVPSFKFLGITDGYEIGYQNGLLDGDNQGWQKGYNIGFRDGFNDGITQSEDVIIYEKILNFNQRIKNGNFTDTSNWDVANGNFATVDNTGVLSATSQYGRITQTNINFVNNHKYLIKGDIRTQQDSNTYYVMVVKGGNYSIRTGTATTTWKKIDRVFTYTSTSGNGSVVIGNDSIDNFVVFEIKNVMLIDLTQMFGDGFEPSIEECENIFTSSYYDYIEQEPIQMGYYTGFYNGKDIGINEGINIGETKQINMNWIQQIFRAIGGVLSIQVFPGVTIGIIVGIPFIISLAWFIIRAFRGGGGA